MKKYTDLNRQMEHLSGVIRMFYMFEDRHNSDKEICFICDFVEEMASKERLEDVSEKYHNILREYIPRISDIEKIAPDIDTKIIFNK